MNTLTPQENRLLRSLSTPWKIQKYLDALPYNKEPNGDNPFPSTDHSRPDRACFEAALLAAAVYRSREPPLILDLESVRDDGDVITVFPVDGHWGAWPSQLFRTALPRHLSHLREW